MGIRAKILYFVGLLVVVALAQMAISWFMSSTMSKKLSAGAGQAVASMGESIRKNESARIGTTLVANTASLQTRVAEVERAAIMTADFTYTVMAMAHASEEGRELAEQEVERFCTVTLKERMPTVSGIGITFEPGAFSPFGDSVYLPYAYRENGGVDFSADLVLPDDIDPDALSDAEKRAYLNEELGQDYYTSVVPRNHNRSAALPQKIVWTSPYIDTLSHYLMLSAVTPLSYEGRVVGATFLDLALTDLDALTESFDASLTPGAESFIFDYNGHTVLSAPGLPEWEPNEVPDPENPGETIVQPRELATTPLGRRIVELAGNVADSTVTNTAWQRDGKDFTLFVGNMHDLFGIAVLVPDDELFADTNAALARSAELEEEQQAEMGKSNWSG